jgi:PAS domain S-box-containing protein
MQVELNQFIEALPGLGWTALPDGQAEYLSTRWLDYAGVTAEQAAGWGWSAILHPDERQAFLESWQSALSSGTPLEAEGRLRRHDGEYRWFLISANPLHDQRGNITRWLATNIDVENRKRLTELAPGSEQSWRQVVDSIPGFVAISDATGRTEFRNQPMTQYFGNPPWDVEHNWTIDIHPDDLQRVLSLRAERIRTGQASDIEFRARSAEGDYRWFLSRARPVRNAEGAITAWYILLTDIDDRKKAEEALRASERALSIAINAIPTNIHIQRADGFNEYVNQPVLDYTGLTVEEMQGEDYRARIVHPEDLARLREERRIGLTSATAFENEMRVRGKDGSYHWFLVRWKPLLDSHGTIIRWYGASFDIEDRKRAEMEIEQAYLRLAEAQRLSKTGSFVTDLLMDEHNWSDEAYRVFEFEPASKLSVQRVRDCVHPEDLSSFDAVIARGRAAEDAEFDFRIVTARGAVKHVRGLAQVKKQVAGRPLFIGAFQDVTESKRAEEALSRARSELAHVVRVMTLNALTASIAHEVNQPLAGIVTNADTCLRMLNSDPPNVNGARETARRTLRDGNRASDVVKRLRALFSKREFALEPLDLNEAVREVIALSLSDLQRNRVILRSELASDLPFVTGDRVQLQQVVLNMLRNASDAMSGLEDRARELLVKTQREEGDHVRLSVIDVGVGFGAEGAVKLFEPFFTTKSDGMGIGLSISRSIIEAHHGRLWATSNEGPGATFSFSIPCGSASPPSQEQPVTQGAPVSASAEGLQGP